MDIKDLKNTFFDTCSFHSICRRKICTKLVIIRDPNTCRFGRSPNKEISESLYSHLAFDENSFRRRTLARDASFRRVKDQERHKMRVRGILRMFRRKHAEGGGDRHEIWIRLVQGHKRKRHGELIGRRGTRETCDLIKSLPSPADGVETEPPHPRRVISLVSTRRRP